MCNQFGHIAKNCTCCFNCGQSGHMRADCTEVPNPDNNQLGKKSQNEKVEFTRHCYTCGGMGHLSRDCPDADDEGDYDEVPECYKCGIRGHHARNCRIDCYE